jgi:hypothetical protein
VKGGFMKRIIFLGVILVFLSSFGWADEKDVLSMEWRAIIAEYNLALTRFQQSSPEFKLLNEFASRLDQKGFMFERDDKGNLTGKIIQKPKKEPETPDPVKKK